MRKSGVPTFRSFAVALALILVSVPALAFRAEQPGKTPLGEKTFFRPDLHISSSNVTLEESLVRVPNAQAWQRFFAEKGADSQVYLDPRSGAPTTITLHHPIIPGSGTGNTLTMADISESLSQTIPQVDSVLVGSLVRSFIEANQEVLGADLTQLGGVRAAQVSDGTWQISIPQEVNGIPVRFGRLLANINHGNLVLIGSENWGNVRIGTTPSISANDALQIGLDYAGRNAQDKIWKDPALEIVPFAPPEHQAGEEFAGPMGQGYGHRLVWTFGVLRPGDPGFYEAMIDANSGELLAFEDKNHYTTEKITGGVYPLTNTGVCPTLDHCGTMQLGTPMPYANTGFPPPNDFTNSAGLYQYSSGTLNTTLSGKFVRITDTCGAVNESSATGSLDLGGANGQHDCTTAGSSPGDTAATRAAFYEVNKLKEQARGWLPANPWLQQIMQTNVNIASTCNAFYSPSAGTINFYRSGGGCGNTGEIAAVFDHEWGHGLDDNDTLGVLSNSSESYADITAILRLQSSCVGYGFFVTSNQGCGMTLDGTGFNGDNGQTGSPNCELDCSGVRGTDWDRHADHTPDTPANFVCPRCVSGSGPCGREVHCDAAPATELVWDLVARDLRGAPFNYDSNTAFMVANKLFYQGSGSIGNWYTCSCPSTSNGCGAANQYMQWLTADDDNGNLNDGTPHMTAIAAAANRHGVGCATPTVQNSGCAAGPTAAPSVTLSAGSNQITVNWGPVAGATAYWVLRSEGFAGCDFGKARIGIVAAPGTSYTDNDVANGRPYSYVVVAQGTTEACYGPASACQTASPQPCAGSVSLDRLSYNCDEARINITLVDSDLVADGTHDVTIFSGTETTPETVTLMATPPGSGVFTGFFLTTGDPASHGDSHISVVDGDTVTVRYTDASFCGTPNVNVDKTAAIDCIAPIISNVHANNITGSGANILWDTNEPADSLVTYDTVSPPTANNVLKAALVTSHNVPLTGLSECTLYYYSVQSTDASLNTASDANGGPGYTFTTGKNVNPTYPYTGPPVPILDPPSPGASATIAVADNKIIQDVNIKIGHITHTFDGDLEIHLIHGASDIIVVNRRGGSGDNFVDTVLDDEATTPIASGAAPLTGTFKPDNAMTVWDGQNSNGNWTLKVVDLAGVDTGTLDAWSIQFTYPPQACGPSLEYQSSTPQESCSGSGSGGGNNVVDPGEDVTLPVTAHNNGTQTVTTVSAILSTTTPGVTITDNSATFPNIPADGSATSDAPHFKFSVDSGMPCGTTINFKLSFSGDQGNWSSDFTMAVGLASTQQITYNSTDVPKPLPDVVTTTSVVNVPDTGTVLDVNVGVSLQHTFDGDLVITLIGPNGVRVPLSNRRGGSGDNFTNTVFDDEAATPVASGVAPFTGSFRPDGFLSGVDGIPANGTWTLEIQDAAAVDSGTLTAWSLAITMPAPPTCENCSVAAPGEVVTLEWTSGTKNELQWSSAPNAAWYSLYRGERADMPKLLNANVDSCRRAQGGGLSTGATITELPAVGSFRWFLVRAGNPGGEGPSGNGTGGPRIVNSSGPCP